MLQRVKVIAEGNGSLLDDSIVQYGSGMKYGNCQIRENRPILLAGVGQGRMKMERYLVCSKHTPLFSLHATLARKLEVGQEIFSDNSITDL